MQSVGKSDKIQLPSPNLMSYLLLTLLQRLSTALLRLPLECLYAGGAHLPTERGQSFYLLVCFCSIWGPTSSHWHKKGCSSPTETDKEHHTVSLGYPLSHTHTHMKDKDIW